MNDDLQKLDSLYESYKKVYVVYFTSINGVVKVVHKELNKRPMVRLIKGTTQFVSNTLCVQEDISVDDIVYVYVWVMPYEEDDMEMAGVSDENCLEFKRFLDNVKPSDFKQK